MRKTSGSTSPRKISRGRTIVFQNIENSGNQKENSLRVIPSNNLSMNQQETSGSLPLTVKEGNKEALEPVVNAFKDLDNVVNNLNENIVNIVKKQNKGFIQTYKHDIIYRKIGLQALHNQYQESIAKVNKDEKVLELENENHFLREEAMKISKLLEDKENQIKALRSQISNLKDENNVLASYVKYKLKKNYQEKVELEQQNFEPPSLFKPSHMRSHSSKGRERYSKENNMNKTFLTTNGGKIDLSRTFTTYEVEETDMDLPPPRTKMEEVDRFIDILEEKSFNNKLTFLRETEKFCKELVSFYEKKLQETQKKFSKEKVKMETMTNWKLGENRELFDFYHQCIEEVRKNIAQRKIATRTSLRSSLNKTKQGFDLKELNSTNYEDFLLKDKQRVLELFVSHPQVLEVIKYIIFPLKDRNDTNNRIRSSIARQQHHTLGMNVTSPLFSFVDKTSENISNENSFYPETRTSHGLSLPKTPGAIALDFSKLPKTAETEEETLASDHLTTEPGVINIKFAQLLDSKVVPAFQPKDRIMMKNISNSYKI